MKKILEFFKKKPINNNVSQKFIFDEYFVSLIDNEVVYWYAVNYKKQEVFAIRKYKYNFFSTYTFENGCIGHLNKTNQVPKKVFLKAYDNALEYFKTMRP